MECSSFFLWRSDSDKSAKSAQRKGTEVVEKILTQEFIQLFQNEHQDEMSQAQADWTAGLECITQSCSATF
jgi:hypothetical protein